MAEAVQSRGIGRFVQVRPGEGRALLLSFGYFFCLLACYYVLRPVRDEMGIRSGVGNLPWLFTATFVVNLLIAPLYAGLVSRLRRGVFIPVVYAFLLLNMLGFWFALTTNAATAWVGITFFVWITVFSVFAVSIFWSFMADLFSGEQSKRLFPTIAAGGSLGGVAGGAMVTGLATVIGPANLLLVAAVLLALSLACAVALDRMAGDAGARTDAAQQGERKVGGGFLAGFRTLFTSPFVGGVGLWVFLLSLAGTFAYFMQAAIISEADLSSAERTQVFGLMDMTANILIPVLQLTLARWVIQRLGVGVALSTVTVVFIVGFLALAAAPILPVMIAFQIAQRAGSFAFANPAREALWPVVDREDKYKAKNVVDNAVFRGGDVANAWLFNTLQAGAGLGLSAIALIGAPIAAGWLFLSLALGRTRDRREAELRTQTTTLKEATP